MSSKLRLQILREVALLSDNFQSEAENLGSRAAKSLTDSKRSQITGLESLANSALRATDVFDFIKLRIARQEAWRGDNWGAHLLEFICDNLREQRTQICSRLQIQSPSLEAQEVYLMLIREFVRQFAAHYEYALKYPNSKLGGNHDSAR
ncbi:MAG: hypothetical protein KGS73_06090 [Chloroflexi bacterium]|jgi:hypothetical protein|nr:hypothetical protein [Chloroflexota bacterium]